MREGGYMLRQTPGEPCCARHHRRKDEAQYCADDALHSDSADQGGKWSLSPKDKLTLSLALSRYVSFLFAFHLKSSFVCSRQCRVAIRVSYLAMIILCDGCKISRLRFGLFSRFFAPFPAVIKSWRNKKISLTRWGKRCGKMEEEERGMNGREERSEEWGVRSEEWCICWRKSDVFTSWKWCLPSASDVFATQKWCCYAMMFLLRKSCGDFSHRGSKNNFEKRCGCVKVLTARGTKGVSKGENSAV